MMDPNDDKPANLPEAAIGVRPRDLCNVEKYFIEKGCAEFVYDEDLDASCFAGDGRFVFCDEFADWELLLERGYLTF